MMSLKLFVVACLLGGAGGAAGSVLGHGFGDSGLRLGAILGGLLAGIVVARLAAWRQWIIPSATTGTAVGAAVGFLAAAAVATHTLSTPVGPIASTLLIGTGAVLGSHTGRELRDDYDHAP